MQNRIDLDYAIFYHKFIYIWDNAIGDKEEGLQAIHYYSKKKKKRIKEI